MVLPCFLNGFCVICEMVLCLVPEMFSDQSVGEEGGKAGMRSLGSEMTDEPSFCAGW